MAVAQVVLNRVDSPHYPDDVCAVVNQPSQFANNVVKVDPETIRLAGSLDNFDDVTQGATHFFSGPAPYWAKKFTQTAKIGNHTFMREK